MVIYIPWRHQLSGTELGGGGGGEARSQTHKRLKERFLLGRNRTKRAHFRGSPLYQTTYNRKTEKQTINSTYFVSVGYGRLAEGKGTRLTDVIKKRAWRKLYDAINRLCLKKKNIEEEKEAGGNRRIDIAGKCFLRLKSVLLITCVFWIQIWYSIPIYVNIVCAQS